MAVWSKLIPVAANGFWTFVSGVFGLLTPVCRAERYLPPRPAAKLSPAATTTTQTTTAPTATASPAATETTVANGVR